jgi:GDP-L-fucose synthase
VDDMAAASLHVMNLPKNVYDQHTSPMLSHINVGYGHDVTISQLASLISKAVGYQGKIKFDSTKPDGPPRKLMDSSRLNALGWQPKVDLEIGLTLAYEDFLDKYKIGK